MEKNHIEFSIRIDRGGLGLKTQNGLLWWSRGRLHDIFPPNRLVWKVFLIVCFLWENFIELRIRIDREWTCFKGAKWFVLITSGKLWSLPSRKPIGSKSVFVDVLCKGNHIDLRIRTDREWAWFEDSKQFAMITSRKPWNNFPPKRMG